ncbi:MAG: GGDEF domain-containing protein [Candidatus Shapirobacteria bacterium]|nr:GGDEF domain-containing protein [Candidatus Shapirobacteria bacterium]MDD3002730.1 GGDEF domain-containing protein [Candidatus Shapirobacteria bacterium]MDD4382919.1 GGDEF domain-containing protein [Candidatus Shapirobacteria bacterium]
MTKGMEFINPNLNLDLPPKPDIFIPILKAADKLKERIDKAEQESVVDSLTGCYNRNFFEKFKQEHFDPNRDNNRIGLVFVDVNNLKIINDTQGHEAGDTLIKNTANFLKSNFRKEDLIIRLGGDEFIVICRNYDNSSNFEEKLLYKITEKLAVNPNKKPCFWSCCLR